MKNKKSLLSVLLAAVLLCACVAGMLVTGVSAEEPTHEVLEVDGVGASGSGKYQTVTAALRSVSSSSWAPGSTLTIEISVAMCSRESLAMLTDGSSWAPFQTWTKFVSDGTKLPITIRSIYIPEGETEARSGIGFLLENYRQWSLFFTNDYTFENIDFYTKQVQNGTNSNGSPKYRYDRFFAGMGDVTFKNVGFNSWIYNYTEGTTTHDSTKDGTVYDTRGVQFFGDMYSAAFGSSYTYDGIMGAWGTANFDANKGEDGLLKVGFTFDDTNYFTSGSNVGSPSPQIWQQAYVAASYGTVYSKKNRSGFTLSQSMVHAHITVTGESVMTRLNGFRSNPAITAPGKVSLNVEENSTVYGVFADSGNGGNYHDNNWDAYIATPRKVNVEINISGNATIKGNNGSGADSCSVSGISDATYTADSKVVININGGTFEQEIIAVGGHNVATGSSSAFYNLPLDTAGEFIINIEGGIFQDNIYGIYSKNIYNCNTLRGTVDVNLYAPVDKTVYGVYSDATDKPNYKGTIDETEKGKGSVVADGAKVTVNVLSGTHTQAIYGIGGGAGAVEAGGEISLVLNGATVEGTFGLGEGTDYAVEAGAIASYYLTKGSVPAALVPVSVGSKSAEVDTFAAGSTLSIEVGDLNYVASADETYPTLIKNAYIGGNVEVLFNGNVSFPVCHESKTTVRLLYSCYIGGNYTLDIKPEAGKSIVSKVPFQTSYGSYINGNSTITVDGGTEKNVHFEKDFFGATGYNTIQSLSNAMFDAGIYSDRSGATGRGYRDTAAGGANDVTWNLNNITAKYFYPSQYNVAGGGMNIYGKLTNNIENSKITGTSYMGSYRSYYKDSKGSVTQTVPVINEIENNFNGGNTFSGTVYCGGRTANQSTPEYGSTGKIVNKISGTNSFGTFYAGANATATYHSESIGSITTTIEDGSTFGSFYAGSKYAWYKDGVESSITTTINGGTFKGSVYAGNPSGTAANTQTLTIKGGTFKGTVSGDGVALAENANVTILEDGQINADTVGANVTVTKADEWGAFDTVYVTAPADAAQKITVVNGDGVTGYPVILKNGGYELRGIFGMQAQLFVETTTKLRVYFDKLHYDAFVEKEDSLDYAFKMAGIEEALLSGTEVSASPATLADGREYYYVELRAVGAGSFGSKITATFNEGAVLEISILEICELGIERATDPNTKEVKLFKALYDYGAAACEKELKYTSDLRFDATGLDSDISDNFEKGENPPVAFNGVTLLMGDAIGIRFKFTPDAAIVAKNFKLVIGTETFDFASGMFLVDENGYLAFFVKAESLSSKLNVTVMYGESVCMKMTNLSVKDLITLFGDTDKATATKNFIQATQDYLAA